MITIDTLKHNYKASGIIKELKSKGFTIYRSTPKHLRDRDHVIEWVVGLPRHFQNDHVGNQNFFGYVAQEIRKITENDPDIVIKNDFGWSGWGLATILILSYLDADLIVNQRL